MALLELDELETYYGTIHALKGISLKVERGEIVTLIGSNGAGKSTALKTISGLLKARRGKVTFAGQTISNLAPHLVARLGIAHVPEGRRIFPRMTVLENLEMGAYHQEDRKQISRDLERVFSLFPRLKERISQKGGTLSGGEQQMLAIARGLMSRPEILLLDEPSMGLAPVLVEQVFDTIKELNREGATILLVEQNALQALQVASRGYVIQTGSIILTDAADRLRRNSMVREAYLGEA